MPDVENNYWTKWVQENFGDKYNITVEYVGITRSDVMTDYAMLAASQSLPTICMEYDYDKLASWQADGYLQTYDVEEFKQIAPTYWETMVEHGNDAYTKLLMKIIWYLVTDLTAIPLIPGVLSIVRTGWRKQDFLSILLATTPSC